MVFLFLQPEPEKEFSIRLETPSIQSDTDTDGDGVPDWQEDVTNSDFLNASILNICTYSTKKELLHIP